MTEGKSENQNLSTQDGLDLYNKNKLAPAFFAVLFFAAVGALAYTLAAFVHDIIVALVLVAMFRPLYHRISKALGRHRWIASAVVTTIIACLVAAPLAFLAIALVQQADAAYVAIADLLGEGLDGKGAVAWALQQLETMLARLGVRLSPEYLDQLMARAGQFMQEGAFAAGGSVLSNLAALLVHGAVLLMIVFYLLVDIERLRDFAFKLSPLPEEDEMLLIRKFSQVAKGTLIGNGIGSVGQGALCGLAMWAAGLPSPLFGAAVMSILAFLPLLGVSIVVIPLGIYLFVSGSPATGTLFLFFCLGQAAIFENVVKTKLIGAGAAMHDLLAFLAIVGGLGVFGVLGLLYGPLLAAAFLTLTELYFASYRRTLALNFIGRSA
jgi:predicted PurR-regulated permease PerM